MTVRYRHASLAITGAREEQEDASAFAFPDARALYFTSSGRIHGTGELLAVLADGMGGHVGGARASRLACKSFIEAYTQSTGEPGPRLRSALEATNRALRDEVAASPALSSMGCTLLAATFGDTGIRWISVGDSRLYLFRDRHLYLLNEDHSLAPIFDQLAAEGRLTKATALAHPDRRILRSAVTGEEIELVDLHDTALPVEPEDWVILASDGIETLPDGEIADLIAAHRDRDAAELSRALLDAVAAAGNPQQDNATIMAVRPQAAENATA